MPHFIPVAYLLAAAVNLTPSLGVVSSDALTRLYAVPVDSPELALLLRHRAVLFAIVGGTLLSAAFVTQLRTHAGVTGLTSMLSFILLHWLSGADNASLNGVALIDAAAACVLAAGLAAHLRSRRLP